MRRQQLEIVVIKAVERVLTGLGNEDSLIEFKSEWPDASKARQLAGHANSARGEEIVWIIGVDEKARTLTAPEPPDLAKWWAQLSKRFDGQVAPEITDLAVPVGDGGLVTALLFQTDRSPYLVTVHGGAVEREIPMRDGTRTRSATRFEVLKLLSPAASVPQLAVLEASAEASETSVRGREWWSVEGKLGIYVDQKIEESCFFPLHEMSGTLEAISKEGEIYSIPLELSNSYSTPMSAASRTGVEWRSDGVMAAGPTALTVRFLASNENALPGEIAAAATCVVKITLGVAGARRQTKVISRFSVADLQEFAVRRGRGRTEPDGRKRVLRMRQIDGL
ncbi:hypothetical protein ACIP98_21165 [Streptomyces sp. NPDC088354]|uniref:hypothetical protein n=1 Tax=Streptomyces sp. NPDC088354 TaxID=3365856 RepID=UPI0038098090